MVDLTPQPRDRTCPQCGKVFASQALFYEGREVFAGVQCLCAECANRREQAEQAEKLLAAAQHVEKTWEQICPLRFYDTDPAKLPCHEAMNAVIGWRYGPQGLLCHGGTGLGKTRCLYLLLRRLYVKERRSVAGLQAAEFGTECSRLFKVDLAQAAAYSKSLIEVGVLMLDDLDKCRFSERVESELYRIVDARTANKRPILASLNSTGEALESTLSDSRGSAIIRRLREFCTAVEFKPPQKYEQHTDNRNLGAL